MANKGSNVVNTVIASNGESGGMISNGSGSKSGKINTNLNVELSDETDVSNSGAVGRDPRVYSRFKIGVKTKITKANITFKGEVTDGLSFGTPIALLYTITRLFQKLINSTN